MRCDFVLLLAAHINGLNSSLSGTYDTMQHVNGIYPYEAPRDSTYGTLGGNQNQSLIN